jgi:hypothetical protein
MVGPWRLGSLLGVAAFALAVSPVFGDVVDGVPVVQGDQVVAGGSGRQPLDSPGDDFTEATAESTDTDVVKVAESPRGIRGDGGVSFTIGRKTGVAVITVTWINPKTRQKRKQFVVVNTFKTAISSVDTVTVTEGEIKPVTSKGGVPIIPNPTWTPGTHIIPIYGVVGGYLIITVEPKPAAAPGGGGVRVGQRDHDRGSDPNQGGTTTSTTH